MKTSKPKPFDFRFFLLVIACVFVFFVSKNIWDIAGLADDFLLTMLIAIPMFGLRFSQKIIDKTFINFSPKLPTLNDKKLNATYDDRFNYETVRRPFILKIPNKNATLTVLIGGKIHDNGRCPDHANQVRTSLRNFLPKATIEEFIMRYHQNDLTNHAYNMAEAKVVVQYSDEILPMNDMEKVQPAIITVTGNQLMIEQEGHYSKFSDFEGRLSKGMNSYDTPLVSFYYCYLLGGRDGYKGDLVVETSRLDSRISANVAKSAPLIAPPAPA